jgi:NB-ARC domain
VPVIAVIGGSAGAGKTALAVHWAHQVADRFADGQLYVDLCGFGPGSPVSPAEALRGFLAALGVAAARIPQGGAAQAGLYRSLLASRRMLILLDNAADAGQARPLLPASPGCLVVITSRGRLTGLATAEAAHFTTLGTLSEAEGRELLAHRLSPQRLASEPKAASGLVRLCAGLPLALAIAAGRIAADPGLRIATVARQLEDPGTRLDALETQDPATSARPVFSRSYRTLSNPAAHLFRLIGLHGSTDITPPAAASLAGIQESHAGRLLHELTHTHLAAEQADGRFTIHPLLCAYAAEQARADARREATPSFTGLPVSCRS